ncbi:MAG: phosphoribosylglycinamide formyltransferase [Anaplasmataceae bacterium]|nr:phosphoribosylglycinamide formyltransferase [Anaplasmataceae bacterium]
MKLIVIISGNGSNFKSLYNSSSVYGYEISKIISSSNNALGNDFAIKNNINLSVINRKDYDNKKIFEDSLLKSIFDIDFDIICLAGFMYILSQDFIEYIYKMHKKIINIHPSLLPSFKGLNAQKQAFEAGVTIAGCTVHHVDQYLDNGEIILQGAVPVLSDDTMESLRERILKMEHLCYPKAIAKLMGIHKNNDSLFYNILPK